VLPNRFDRFSFIPRPRIDHARRGRAAFAAVVCLLLSLACGVVAHAQTISTWSGNDGINRWTKKKNWMGGIVPAPSQTTWLTFAGNIDPTNINDFAAGSDFAGFVFAGTVTPFTLTGNSVDLFDSILNLDSLTQTVSLDAVNLAAPTVTFGSIGNLVVTSPIVGTGGIVKTLSGTVSLQGANSYQGGTEIRAGTIEIATSENLGVGPITLAGGALRINNPGTTSLTQDIVVTTPSILEVTQGTTVLAGSITGDARLIIAGGGLFQGSIDGAAFTGVIDLQSARLQLSATHFVPVAVHGGEADLDGSVGDLDVYDGGKVEVVDPLATGLLHTLNLSLQGGGQLSLGIAGTAGGATADGYDQIKVAGSVALGGILELTLLNGFTPTIGQSFFVIDNDGTDPISGAFSNAPSDAIITLGGVNFAVSYVGDAGTGQTVGGNDLVLTAVPPVPELTPLSLGGVGMLQLLRRRTLKKRFRARTRL
jgi:autotransporter-associated beta strand protein